MHRFSEKCRTHHGRTFFRITRSEKCEKKKITTDKTIAQKGKEQTVEKAAPAHLGQIKEEEGSKKQGDLSVLNNNFCNKILVKNLKKNEKDNLFNVYAFSACLQSKSKK